MEGSNHHLCTIAAAFWSFSSASGQASGQCGNLITSSESFWQGTEVPRGQQQIFDGNYDNNYSYTIYTYICICKIHV